MLSLLVTSLLVPAELNSRALSAPLVVDRRVSSSLGSSSSSASTVGRSRGGGGSGELRALFNVPMIAVYFRRFVLGCMIIHRPDDINLMP